MLNKEKLYDFAHEGDVHSVNLWLNEHPDDLNAKIGEGYFPLHVACMFGHEKLVHSLVSRGALINANTQNASQSTPLHLSVLFRDEQVADQISRYLIDHGAELNSPEARRETPLHHAVTRDSVLLVTMLIEAGADPFLKDAQDRSASDLAKELKLENGEAIREVLKRAFRL